MASSVERTATPATAEIQGKLLAEATQEQKTKRLRIESPGAVNGETHERDTRQRTTLRKGKGTLAVTQTGPHNAVEETLLD